MTYPSPFCGHFPSSGLARNRITAYHAPRFRQAAKLGVAVLYGTSHRLEVFRQSREEPRSAARGARRSHEGGERGAPLISFYAPESRQFSSPPSPTRNSRAAGAGFRTRASSGSPPPTSSCTRATSPPP